MDAYDLSNVTAGRSSLTAGRGTAARHASSDIPLNVKLEEENELQ